MSQLQEMKARQQQGVAVTNNDMAHPIKGKLMMLDQRKDLLGAGASTNLVVEREIRTAGIMLVNSKDLQAASASSFYTSVSIAINSGIGLGRGMGYLVAYKGVCSFVPGWRGLVDLVSRSGRATVWTGVVHKGDEFDYALGDSPFLKHRPGDVEDHKHITHYYAIGRVKGSEWPVIEVWSVAKVKRHLSDYNKVGGRHYALKDDNNMEQYGRKVALLQVIKYMPQSQDVANALAADAAHDTGQELIIDGDFAYLPDDMQGGAEQGEQAQPAASQAQPAKQEEKPAAQPAAAKKEPSQEDLDYQRSMAAQPAAEQVAPTKRVNKRTTAS